MIHLGFGGNYRGKVTGNKEIYIRRYDMLTGVVDVGFGTAGELFVYSTVGSSPGYSSYYNGQVIKPVNVLDPHSYILKDGFILTLQTPQDRTSFRVYKFDFTTELLNSRVLTSADYPASANYTISEILNISITKDESIFVTAKFVGDPGIYHGEILKLSNSNFGTDITFGTNGFMFINGGTSNISGSGMDISAREVIKVTDDYIYLMKQVAHVEQDVNGTFLKYQLTPGYQRLSYSGLSDTTFENSMAQRAESYSIQFNGGKTNFGIVQSTPISKSHNYFTVFMFGIYANDMAEFLNLSSDTAVLYSTVHVATVKFEFKDHESFTDTIFKAFPFLDFMNGEITDESFLLQEMYSFDKGEYVYKIAISSFDDQGQPIFKLFKLYN